MSDPSPKRPRTLIVGPLGERPWLSTPELVRSLEAIGHDVIVNGEPVDVIPTLKPVPSRLGVFVNSAPSLMAWLVRMLLRWRRTARRSLRRAGVDEVLVWDEVLAMLCSLAKPRNVKVVWVAGPTEGSRLYQRVLRAAVARSVDQIVTSWDDDERFAGRRHSVVRMALPSVEPSTPLVDGWVVFGSERPVSAQSFELLRQRAAQQPAAALIFSARGHDRMLPVDMQALVDAVRPAAVWWVTDAEWVERLGGVPKLAVDPADELEIDHRHLLMLGIDQSVLVAAQRHRRSGDRVATCNREASGWYRLALTAPSELLADDHEWAAHAFGVRR